MEISRSSIPDADPAHVAVHIVASEPGTSTVTLVVDADAIARGPIIRGDGPPFLAQDGRRVTAQAEQRSGFPFVDGDDASHVATFRRRHPGRTPLAVTGCGNLGLNLGVHAYVDGQWLGHGDAPTGALRIHPDGHAARIAEADRTSPPDDGSFVLTGPDLVVDGHPATPVAAAYADPRHLLLFPYTEVQEGVRVDFGCDRLLTDPTLYTDAVAGRLVTLRLEERLPDSDRIDATSVTHAVSRTSLASALATKGYRPTTSDTVPIEPGTYRLNGDALDLVFLPGIYPHHVLAVRNDGAVASLLVTGLSNRAGVTIDALSRDLVRLGFRDAILMDNGGDVGLYRPATKTFDIRPAEPDRRHRWPLTACLVWHSAR